MADDYQSPGYNSGNNKSHTMMWVLVIILLVLIVGGGIAYFVHKNNESKSTTSASTSTSTNSSTPAFNPSVNSNQPYTATVSSDVNGQQKSATMISDGQGNYSYTYQLNGQTVTIIYTPSAYYLCNGSAQCLKYTTTNASASGFDPSTYQYDSTKLENLKQTAAYKGQQTCPGGTGTCEVWSVAKGNATTTLIVDATSKKIVKATYSSGTTSTDVTYEYKSVHIAVPTSYTTVPSK